MSKSRTLDRLLQHLDNVGRMERISRRINVIVSNELSEIAQKRVLEKDYSVSMAENRYREILNEISSIVSDEHLFFLGKALKELEKGIVE